MRIQRHHVTFDNMGGATITAPAKRSSYQISTIWTNVLHTAGYATSSASVSGGIGEQGAASYVGDNFVTGPTKNGTVYPSLWRYERVGKPKDSTKWYGADANNPPVLSNSNPAASSKLQRDHLDRS